MLSNIICVSNLNMHLSIFNPRVCVSKISRKTGRLSQTSDMHCIREVSQRQLILWLPWFPGFRLWGPSNSPLPTNSQYKWGGRWRTDKFIEEELYDLVSPNLSDLVDVIKIRKLLSPIGDAYSMIEVPIEAGTLQNSGIMIIRKDYYYNLKTYCILLR